ncbi:hypothetical protein K5V21_12620 [Clostridium sardiniense]|uniref:Uncharacterized protein n=1 Tax=Clostridium sardiniense TaxID=29369 RepID=A0ABS7KZQ7_CLOSR|nr:hypothetical protein [Clostridium sardiniense]MDQ0461444.1 hypothetical protein [Clostridium sardiniense]
MVEIFITIIFIIILLINIYFLIDDTINSILIKKIQPLNNKKYKKFFYYYITLGYINSNEILKDNNNLYNKILAKEDLSKNDLDYLNKHL